MSSLKTSFTASLNTSLTGSLTGSLTSSNDPGSPANGRFDAPIIEGNSLSASIRRQIIEFDSGLPDAVSISQFCKQLGISRPTYYKVKERYVAEGNKALNPHSRAPKTTSALAY